MYKYIRFTTDVKDATKKNKNYEGKKLKDRFPYHLDQKKRVDKIYKKHEKIMEKFKSLDNHKDDPKKQEELETFLIKKYTPIKSAMIQIKGRTKEQIKQSIEKLKKKKSMESSPGKIKRNLNFSVNIHEEENHQSSDENYDQNLSVKDYIPKAEHKKEIKKHEQRETRKDEEIKRLNKRVKRVENERDNWKEKYKNTTKNSNPFRSPKTRNEQNFMLDKVAEFLINEKDDENNYPARTQTKANKVIKIAKKINGEIKLPKPRQAFYKLGSAGKRKRLKKMEDVSNIIDVPENFVLIQWAKKKGLNIEQLLNLQNVESAAKAKVYGLIPCTGRMWNILRKTGHLIGPPAQKIREWEKMNRYPFDEFIVVEIETPEKEDIFYTLKEESETLKKLEKYADKKRDVELKKELKSQRITIDELLNNFEKKKKEESILFYSSNLFWLLSIRAFQLNTTNHFIDNYIFSTIVPVIFKFDTGKNFLTALLGFIGIDDPQSTDLASLVLFCENAADTKGNESILFELISQQIPILSKSTSQICMTLIRNEEETLKAYSTIYTPDAEEDPQNFEKLMRFSRFLGEKTEAFGGESCIEQYLYSSR